VFPQEELIKQLYVDILLQLSHYVWPIVPLSLFESAPSLIVRWYHTPLVRKATFGGISSKEPRPIGVFGGTSWPSKIDYYRRLNILPNETFRGSHSADLLLRSIDYDPIKSAYRAMHLSVPNAGLAMYGGRVSWRAVLESPRILEGTKAVRQSP
jgi:hypothetical protein